MQMPASQAEDLRSLKVKSQRVTEEGTELRMQAVAADSPDRFESQQQVQSALLLGGMAEDGCR